MFCACNCLLYKQKHNIGISMNIVNCTPHEVKLNNGENFPISGNVTRVSSSFEEAEKGFFKVAYGEVTG